MSKKEFKPYRDMLDIPSLLDENPTDYQLLGIDEFESDSDKIEAAHEKRTQRIAELYQIVTEMSSKIDSARDRITDSQKKEEYDFYLRKMGFAGLPRMGRFGVCSLLFSFISSIVIVVVSTFYIYPMVVAVPVDNIGDSVASLPDYNESQSQKEIDVLKEQQEDISTMNVNLNLPIDVDSGSSEVDLVEVPESENPVEESAVEDLPDADEIATEDSPAVSEESTVEEPAVEEPALPEAPAVEEPALPETPAVEEPALPETPAAEEPALPEAPAVEEPALPEAPAVEEPSLPETPAAEEPKELEAPADAQPKELEAPAAPEPPVIPELSSIPEAPVSSTVPALENPGISAPSAPAPSNETTEAQTSVESPAKVVLEDVDKLEMFVQLGQKARTDEDFAKLLLSARQVEEDLMKEKNFPKAQQIADVVYESCSRCADKTYRSEAYRYKDLVSKRSAWWDSVQEAQTKMDSDGTLSPKDADLVAQWKIEIENDWNAGLRYLVLSENEQVRTAAKTEIEANPADVRSVLDVANGWWNLAQYPVPMQKQFKARAGFWYGKALPSITDKQIRILVEKRISMAGQGNSNR